MPGSVNTVIGPVECEISGNGPVLLSLHGGMGGWDQGQILARALGALPDGFRVVAVSRPGYLGTPQASGSTPEEQADLFAALLDALDIEKAFAVAVSAGGPSAIQFALRHPGRCKGLILVSCCTGHMAVPPELVKRLPFLRLMARFSWLTALMRWRTKRNPARSSIRSIADEELRNRTLAHPEAGLLLQALRTSVFDNMAARLDGTINDMRQFEALTSLPLERLVVPVLVVHGTGDRVVPFAHGEQIAKAASRAELMAIEGGEHVAVFTHLDAIRARAADFFSRNS
jgi:pimeloyl-ACP methyl ester carboxylesterase